MPTSRAVTVALATAAALFLVMLQFAPWAAHSTTHSSGAFESVTTVTASTWSAREVSHTDIRYDAKTTSTTGWYEGAASGTPGVGLLRAAIPALLGATVLSVLTAVLAGVGSVRTAAWTAAAATLCAGAGTGLFAVGVSRLFEGGQQWMGGAGLALGACLVLGLATAASLRPTPTTQPNLVL